MPEAQAGVLADQRAQSIDERLATKSEIRETGLRLEAEIETTKSDISKWMFGQTLALIGGNVAPLRFGHRA